MPSKHRPEDCLADIIENATRIEIYIASMDQSSFEQNGMVRDAVERYLERICEATFRLGDKASELIPHQPWSDIRGLGNRLRHAYDRLDSDTIWRTVSQRVPALSTDAQTALDRMENK